MLGASVGVMEAQEVHSPTVHSHDKQVVCYWGTWANYRPDGGKFTPEHIDPTLCTHLIYSFAGLESINWTMKSLDPWMDLEVGGCRRVADCHDGGPITSGCDEQLMVAV